MADEGAWAFVRHGGGWCAQERRPHARACAAQSDDGKKWSACLIPVAMAAAGRASWTGERMQGRL